MAIVVEDGTGLPNANSYASDATLGAYCDDRGIVLAAGDSEAALIRATQYIETYRNRFPGYRTLRRAQALEWPRIGAYYYVPDNGRSAGLYYPTGYDDQFISPGYDFIPGNVIPIEVIQATCEAAVRELAKFGSTQPDLKRGGAIESLQAGSVRVVYGANASAQTIFQAIDGILGGLLMPGGGGLFGKAVRG